MISNDNKITVGVILDKRGDPPYVSVNKLWTETIDIISKKYNTVILEVDSFNVDNTAEYRRFVDKIDILFLLSPYYTIDRSYKEFPVVFYGLGSMQKGGAWLVDNYESFRSYDKVILNCTSCMNIFDMLVKQQSISSVMIPFGVDINIFRPRDKSAVREKYNIPKDAFVVVYAGRINHQKNPLMLLNTLGELSCRYNKLIYIFVGSFDNFYIPEFNHVKAADIKEQFMTSVERLGITSKIRLFETQNDKNEYAEILSLADIGINITTLISENFGYTPVEMQACGLPVVGTGWGGLKDTIIDEVTGYKVETVQSRYGARINYEQLKNRIETLICDEKLRKEMSHNALINVKKNYSFSKFARNICNIINVTYSAFTLEDHRHIGYFVDSSVRDMMSKIHEEYGEERHVSWEHLHPKLDFEFYDMISTECANRNVEEEVWFKESIISKGFNWACIHGKFVSYDSRWNKEYELRDCVLSDDEISVMQQLNGGETLGELCRRISLDEEQLTEIMYKLSDKGFVMPWNVSRLGNEQISTAAFVIPHYNDGSVDELSWFVNALESVAKQTDSDWKVIIVDDASPNESVRGYLKSLVEKYGKKIEMIFLRKNKGPGNARNVGIKRAAMLGCPFVMYLDSDDIADPKRLERTRKAFLENPSVGVVYSSFDVIDENGNYIEENDVLPSIREIKEQLRINPPQGNGVWRKIAVETGYINLTSATSVRTCIALKFQFPNERVSEDYYVWLLYSACGWEYMFLDSLCMKYRIPRGKDGSRTRRMVGGDHEFNLQKSVVDVKGFCRALDIACSEGEIGVKDKNILMLSFFRRKAESMKKDGENEIANEFYERAIRIEREILMEEYRGK